ncbi:alpha/beta-hydrolase [Annulohypoxylon maeteangense]|uniref:alpha/beta-hydrolase n=1 Tax=Annulohypoxylon maeteangense TaxID=1927788 RepID=UPI0020085FD7|nr:alpha/beta-hydrolase [Annulohypoxylon maeteangense]KAI0887558.1 alpha/beta-hydrolase [Annulohypoxylon maeteangense]
MSQSPPDLKLPQRMIRGHHKNFIAAPSYESSTSVFGHASPKPQYLESDLGTTALYDVPPPSGQSKRHVLIIHGLNTPAIGMLPLAKELQALDPDAYVVLFDLWGHGFSSTPLVAHTPQIFHFQIFQVLGFLQWTRAHIIGYSFGASTAVRFALHNPWAVLSVALLAPAGLCDKELWGEKMQELLENSEGGDAQAIDAVLDWLEGGPLIVPTDWRERVEAGEVVAEVLREWELQHHSGYPHSVLSMFREGGVTGCVEDFRKFAQLPVKKIGIVAELDAVCSKAQLTDVGFTDVEVVEKANHGFVRGTTTSEIARIVYRFWTQ